jgi:hypothetical protein
MQKKRRISAALSLADAPATRRTAHPDAADAPMPQEPDGDAPARLTAAVADAPLRVGVPLIEDDGKTRIAWDRMRDSSREKLRAAMDAEPTRGGDSGPEFGAVIYRALGSVLAAGAVQYWGLTPAEAGIMLFTAEEQATLVPLTDRVLQKHIGPVGDEAMLGVALAMAVSGKIAMAQQIRRKRAEDVSA